MLLFGWGGSKLTDHGAAWMQPCRNCGNTAWMHYVTTHASFRLYFVPLISYDRKHFLMCPVCSQGPQLDDGGVVTVKKAMLLLAQARLGQLNEDEYQAEMARLLNPQAYALAAGAPAIEAQVGGPNAAGFPDAAPAASVSAPSSDASAGTDKPA